MSNEKVNFYQIKGYIGFGGNIYTFIAENKFMQEITVDVFCLINDEKGTLLKTKLKANIIKESFGIDELVKIAKNIIVGKLNEIAFNKRIEVNEVKWDNSNIYDLIAFKDQEKLKDNLDTINRNTENKELIVTLSKLKNDINNIQLIIN